METDGKNRMGELVQELLGAQMVARMLDEFWTTATDEQRAKVLDAAIEQVTGGGKHTISNAVDAAVSRWASELIEERRDELKERIAEKIQPHLDKAIEKDVVRRVDDIIQILCKEVADGIRFKRRYP